MGNHLQCKGSLNLADYIHSPRFPQNSLVLVLSTSLGPKSAEPSLLGRREIITSASSAGEPFCPGRTPGARLLPFPRIILDLIKVLILDGLPLDRGWLYVGAVGLMSELDDYRLLYHGNPSAFCLPSQVVRNDGFDAFLVSRRRGSCNPRRSACTR